MVVRRKDGVLPSRYVYLAGRENQEYVCTYERSKELRGDSMPVSLSTLGVSQTDPGAAVTA